MPLIVSTASAGSETIKVAEESFLASVDGLLVTLLEVCS
jgi:hypothetical protein